MENKAEKINQLYSIFGIEIPKLRVISDMTDSEKRELWVLVFKSAFSGNNIIFIDKTTRSSSPRWVMSCGVERLGIELDGTI